MKKEYYNLISNNELIDIFSEIKELSYSKKLKILQNLLKLYDSSIINKAMIEYKEKYINNNKYNLHFLENTLKYLCKGN